MIVFDIETGPLPDEELVGVVEPFQPPPHPGEFDETKIKYGRLGEEKRQEKKEKLEKEHQQKLKDYDRTCQESREAWWANVLDKAALDATTGKVLAIGYYSTEKKNHVLDIDDEKTLLINFWGQLNRFRDGGLLLVGHNIAGFDLPFLVQRSWVHQIDVADNLLERGQYLNPRLFVDTMLLWNFSRRGSYTKLDTICRALGLPGKLDGVNGAMFADLLQSDPEKAKQYLASDLLATANVAERLGVA